MPSDGNKGIGENLKNKFNLNWRKLDMWF